MRPDLHRDNGGSRRARRLQRFELVRRLGSTILVLALTACGGDGGDGGDGDGDGDGDIPAACEPATEILGSCDFTDDGLELCNALYGDPAANDLADLQTECENETGDGGGAWQLAPCDTADVQGYCLIDTSSSFLTVQHYYPGDGLGSGQAETRCDSIDGFGGATATFCAP